MGRGGAELAASPLPGAMKTVHGSPDGATVRRFVEGEEHDLTSTPRERDLAAVFVREGWARSADTKDLGAAPENKDLGAPPENRTRRVCKTEACGRTAITADGLCERCSDPDYQRATPRRRGR
jgi:hypothetical protein